MKILHVINDLETGGAEKVLYRVIKQNKNQHYLICLQKGGQLLKSFENLNIKIYFLEFDNLFNILKSILRFRRIINNIKPDITQTWLYKSDFIGGLLSYLFGYRNIYWNVRNNKAFFFRTKFIIKILSILSFSIPKKIIICSNSAILSHEKYGYDINKFYLIVNGYDLNHINKITPENKKNTFNLINISRFNLIKNHEFLFKLIKYMKLNSNIKINLYLYGKGLSSNNKQLNNLLLKYDIKDQVILKGFVKNINLELQHMDVHILTSLSESFPNVIAETMTAGIPNISINAGDSKDIIGDTGWLIYNYSINEFKNNIQLAYNEKFFNELKWIKRKERCKVRIQENYSIDKMISSYDKLWKAINNTNSIYNFPRYYDDAHNENLQDLTVIIPSVGRKKLQININILNSYYLKPYQIIISMPHYLKNRIKLPNYNNIIDIYNKKYDQISQRMAAFKKVQTKYVLQLDEDSFIYPNHISSMLSKLKKIKNGNAVIAPVFFNISNKLPLHNYNYFYFNFLNNTIFSYLLGSKWGKNKLGTIAKSGINFGVGTEITGSLKKVEWVPGGCLMQLTNNINRDFPYTYIGKAYCEDIINSYLYKKKKINMYVDTNAYSLTEKSNIPLGSDEFYKFLKMFKYYNKLLDNHNSSYFRFYLFLLRIRKIFNL